MSDIQRMREEAERQRKAEEERKRQERERQLQAKVEQGTLLKAQEKSLADQIAAQKEREAAKARAALAEASKVERTRIMQEKTLATQITAQRAAATESARQRAAEQLAAVKQNLINSQKNIAIAESYKYAWGSEIEWGDKTYDLGTTAGWKSYQAALRKSKSDLSQAENEVKRSETRGWEAKTDREAKGVISKAAKG